VCLYPLSLYVGHFVASTLTHIFPKQNAVFVSGLILVLYTLKTKRAGLSHDKNKDLVQVATAMDFLKFGESR
jgi:hypothetical protein